MPSAHRAGRGIPGARLGSWAGPGLRAGAKPVSVRWPCSSCQPPLASCHLFCSGYFI